jgi:uncharacterized coiled-coil protein SlyX
MPDDNTLKPLAILRVKHWLTGPEYGLEPVLGAWESLPDGAYLLCSLDASRGLERENFKLAAMACLAGFGDEGGTPQCCAQARIAALEARVAKRDARITELTDDRDLEKKIRKDYVDRVEELEAKLRAVIETRDGFGWCREVDDAINDARAAIAASGEENP